MKTVKLLNNYLFVWMALGLMSGIVASGLVVETYLSLSILLTLSLLLLLLRLPIDIKPVGIVFVVLLFFSIGSQLPGQDVQSERKANFEHLYYEGAVYTGQVVQMSRSTKTWNKAVVHVTSIADREHRNPVDEKVLFLIRDEVENLAIGDEIVCVSPLTRIENKKNPGEFDGETYWRSKGISRMAFLYPQDFLVLENNLSWIARWFGALDQQFSTLFESSLQPEAVGVAKAIVLGDRDHLDAEAVRSFGNSGAMHVLAVSGLHIGLILALFVFVFSQFPKRISRYQATVIALVLVWFYALLTGFSASVFRAVVMFSMLTIAKLSGRQYTPLNVLAASAVVLLFVDHLLLFDLGFQLSYLAMTGIFLSYASIKSLFYFPVKVLRWLWEGTSVALAAQLFTFPLTLYCFHQFPNYFLLSNIGLMLLTNLILILGVLFLVAHKIPLLSSVLAWSLSMVVLAMFYFVQWVDYLPGSVAKGFVFSVQQLFGIYALLLLVIFVFKTPWKYRFHLASVAAVVVCCLLVFQRMERNAKNELVIFNESKVIFTLKVNDELYCFYEQDAYLGKAMYIAQAYEKTRSSQLHYVKLEKDIETVVKSKDVNFSCRFERSHYDLLLNGTRIQLTKNWTQANAKARKDREVLMPWLTKTDREAHHLSSGAFVFPF